MGVVNMKRTVSRIILISCLIFPAHSSNYPPQFEFVPVLEHVVKSWDYNNNPVTQDLWAQLIIMEPEESSDIITKTCGLCHHTESDHEKASVGLRFCMGKKEERDEVARLSWGLKRHFGNTGQEYSMSDVVGAFFAIPNYLRPTIYKQIQAEKAPIPNLYQHMIAASNEYGIMQKLSLYFHYKIYDLFSFGNEIADSMHPKLD